MEDRRNEMDDPGYENNSDSKAREQAKQHGDEVEALLRDAGAVREQYARTSLTLSGELQPQFSKGDKVQVRTEDGSWRGGLRAISGIEEVEGQTGAAEKVVWVSWEDEWQAAQAEAREPLGVPWPYEQVEFRGPNWMVTVEEGDVQQATLHHLYRIIKDDHQPRTREGEATA
jgi:hypothetical protein